MKSEVTSRISANQLVVLLVVSRAVTLLTSPAIFTGGACARETVIGIVISVLIMLAITSNHTQEKLSHIKPTKVTALLVVLLLMVSAVLNMLSFVVFFQSESEVIFPAVPICLLVTVIVLYALTNGIEGISRFALIVGTIFILILCFTILTNTSRMDMTNLTFPKAQEKGKNIVNVVFANILMCVEIPAYYALRRFVRKEDAKKPILRRFYLIQALIIAVFVVAQELVFGTYTELQSYPIYALALVGEFSIFQRLDVIHIGVWILVIVVKLSTLTVATTTILSRLYSKAPHHMLNIGVCVVLILGSFAALSIFATNPEFIEAIIIGLFSMAGISMLSSASKRKMIRDIEEDEQ
jgi:hypothetical protein